MLFLLSAAPIGLGCVIVTDDVDTDAVTSATSSPTSTSGETDTPTTGGTEVATEGGSGDSTAGPATTDATTGVDTGGSGDTTTDSGGNVLPGCEDYAALIAECYMDDAAGEATLNYCIEQTDYYTTYGEECLSAFEGFLACLSALTCEELTGADPVCEAESDAVDTACVAA